MEKEQTALRKLTLGLVAFAIISVLTLLVGEIAVRAVIYLKSKTYPTQTTRLVKKLGWETKRNFTFQGEVPDATGTLYTLNYETDENGFRAFEQSEVNSTANRVFYIGDSFTQAIEVSNDKTYYNLVDQHLNLNTFAYGCRGYSTLQEYMILDQYYDQIKPDIFVLQFCYNDFINNSLELESNSIYNNNRRLRPYWQEDGSVKNAYPARLPLRLLNDYSMFFQLVLTTTEKIWNSQVHKKEKTTEAFIASQEQAYAPFEKSIQVTEALLRKMKERLDPDVRFLILHVGTYDDPYFQAIQSISESLNIEFVSESSEHPQLVANAPEVMAKDHFHWNEAGHKIAAEALLKYLQEPVMEEEGRISANQLTSSNK